jgi:hypothetical protein
VRHSKRGPPTVKMGQTPKIAVLRANEASQTLQTNMKINTGGCLCRTIRYEFQGEPDEVLHCHCESCRRQTSSPVATFAMVKTAVLRFTQGQPKAYCSSPGVWRSFCLDCGSPIAYRSDRRPELIDLHVGTLDDPGSVQAWCHVQTSAQLPWFEMLDSLPRFSGSRRGATPVEYGPRKSVG